MNGVLKVALILPGMILALGFIGSIVSPLKESAPRTYGDVTKEATQSCRQEYPAAPDDYCKRIGLTTSLLKLCKDQPWRCDGVPYTGRN